MEKELRLQIERLQEDKNYNDQMYREVRVSLRVSLRVWVHDATEDSVWQNTRTKVPSFFAKHNVSDGCDVGSGQG